jgi:hypothetical protein
MFGRAAVCAHAAARSETPALTGCSLVHSGRGLPNTTNATKVLIEQMKQSRGVGELRSDHLHPKGAVQC